MKIMDDKNEQAQATAINSSPPAKKGVIYLSNIPPYMGVHKLRSYMLQFGNVGRIYLKPEDSTQQKNRMKHNGCKKQKFTEGWIEFYQKSIAKRVALALNGQIIGGKKRHNFWRDDIWTIKYLKNFEWAELAEERTYKRTVRTDKLRVQGQQTQRENTFYLKQVEKRNHRLKQQNKAKNLEKISNSENSANFQEIPSQQSDEKALLEAIAL